MSADELNRLNAADNIQRLFRSERGRACLAALAAFLANDGTYSLDFSNQRAVVALIQAAFVTPSVRDMVAEVVA